MISSTDLKILKNLGEGKSISNIIENEFNTEKEFYDWWNSLAKSNYSQRTEILLNNCEGFQLERKDHGIPKIKSADDKNLFFGYGMVLAHDRLFQLDFLRRKAIGSLSEVMGKKTLDIDIVAKTMDFVSIAKKEYSEMPKWSKELLDSFTDGINHYIDKNRELTTPILEKIQKVGFSGLSDEEKSKLYEDSKKMSKDQQRD